MRILLSHRWFVVCVALLLLGVYAPQLSGQQSRCALCADHCQQADGGQSHESGNPFDHSQNDGCGTGCDQCLFCHGSTAQLLPAMTVPTVIWTQTRVEFSEWKPATYGSPLSEIDHPPQLS